MSDHSFDEQRPTNSRFFRDLDVFLSAPRSLEVNKNGGTFGEKRDTLAALGAAQCG